MDARTAHLFQHISLHNQALVLPPLPPHRETFADFCVPSTPCPIRRLPHLTPHLTPKVHAPFVYLAEHDLRLEQERISHSDAVKQLISMLFL
jgi:hypothetical protein